jgi:antitoxin component YwqK of YwqJK toxin-antitoxin module
MSGEQANIRTLQQADLKYGDKPTLIAAWSNKYCPPCVRRINELVAAGVDKEFNIITLNIDSEESVPKKVLEDSIAQRKGWNRLTHYRANDLEFEKAIGTTTVPYWFVFDKQLKLVNAFLTYGVTVDEFESLLSGLDSKELALSAPTLYFSNDRLTTKTDAEYYVRRTVSGDRITLKKYWVEKDVLSSEASYTLKKDTFFYNGPFKSFHKNGKVAGDAIIQMGKVTTGKFWYEDGTLKQEELVPGKGVGFRKTWRADGSLERHLVYRDGKLNGLSKVYDEKGRLVQDMTFVMDEASGPSKEYIEGLAVKETVYSGGKVVSESLLAPNIAEVKRSIIASLNKIVPPTLAVATDEAWVEFDAEEPNLLYVLHWKDLERGSAYTGSLYVVGTEYIYDSKSTTNPLFEFRQKKYGRVNKKWNGQELKMEEAKADQVETLITTLHRLLNLK